MERHNDSNGISATQPSASKSGSRSPDRRAPAGFRARKRRDKSNCDRKQQPNRPNSSANAISTTAQLSSLLRMPLTWLGHYRAAAA
jgi:hypothetical protein